MFVWLNLILVAAIGFFSLQFAMANQTEVTVHIPGGVTFDHIPLFGLVLVPLLIGLLVGSLTGWLSSFKPRQRVGQLLQENRELEEELANLRNLPLEDDIQL
ncbi:MAG: LapA family protein [Magnetococcales bacterium]|nr:LapA family protein [Magnetococcales bacterium]